MGLSFAEHKGLRSSIAQQVICLDNKFQSQSLPPSYQKSPCKRSIMLESFKSDKVLVVWVLPKLVNKISVCKAHMLLDNKRAHHHSAKLGYVSCFGWKQSGIERFPCSPWKFTCDHDPFVLRIQLQTAG